MKTLAMIAHNEIKINGRSAVELILVSQKFEYRRAGETIVRAEEFETTRLVAVRPALKKLLESVEAMIEAMPEPCEGCGFDATTQDSEGVDLCARCMAACVADDEKKAAAEKGGAN